MAHLHRWNALQEALQCKPPSGDVAGFSSCVAPQPTVGPCHMTHSSFRNLHADRSSAGGPPVQRLLLGDVADFVCRVLFVMGIAASPHGAGFGDEPALSQAFADCMDALTGCREALRKLQGTSLPAADVLDEICRCVQGRCKHLGGADAGLGLNALWGCERTPTCCRHTGKDWQLCVRIRLGLLGHIFGVGTTAP